MGPKVAKDGDISLSQIKRRLVTRIWMPSNLDLIFFPSSMGNAINLNHTISWLINDKSQHTAVVQEKNIP